MIKHSITKLGGRITFDSISHQNHESDTPLILDDLKEDLLQAVFPLDQTLDIGWYPEFCEEGHFRVVLVAKSNWETPIHAENVKNWGELWKAVENTLRKIKHKHYETERTQRIQGAVGKLRGLRNC